MTKLLKLGTALGFLLVCSAAPAKNIYKPGGTVYDCKGETNKDCLSDCNKDHGCDYNESGPSCCYEKGGVIYKPTKRKPIKR